MKNTLLLCIFQLRIFFKTLLFLRLAKRKLIDQIHPPNFRGYWYYLRTRRVFHFIFVLRKIIFLGRGVEDGIQNRIRNCVPFRFSRWFGSVVALFHTYRLRIIFPGCSNIHSLLFYSRTRPTFAFFPFSFFFKTLVASRRRKNIKQDLSFLLFHFSVN